MVERINYKYLGFTFVLLLLTYFLIVPRHIAYEKISTDQFNKNTVKIFTKGKISQVDHNLLVINLNKIKYSIRQFEKSATYTDSHQIALSKFLKNAKNNISSYININSNKQDINKYEEILKEKMLKQIAKKNKIELANNENDNDDLYEFKYYIDVVITMIQSYKCNHGVFNFDSITEVLNLLNKINKTKSVNLLHHMGKTGSVDDEEVARRKQIIHAENQVKSFSETFTMLEKNRQIRHTDDSQTRLDKTMTENRQKIKMQNAFDYTRIKTKTPEYNFTSHSDAIKFKNITRQPGTTNKSSGSHAHDQQLISDRLLDITKKSSLYL